MPSPLDEPEAPTPIRTPDLPEPSSSETHTVSAASKAEGKADMIQHNPPLAIESPQSSSAQGLGKDQGTQTLDLGEGNVIKMDKLGPMIINSDGTLSRIQNWQDLHPIEQERTVRLLVKKRNLVRLQKLDQEEQAGNAGGERPEEKLSALQKQD